MAAGNGSCFENKEPSAAGHGEGLRAKEMSCVMGTCHSQGPRALSGIAGRGSQPGGDLHPATGSLFKHRGVQSKPNSMSSWSPASGTVGFSGFVSDRTPLFSKEERCSVLGWTSS